MGNEVASSHGSRWQRALLRWLERARSPKRVSLDPSPRFCLQLQTALNVLSFILNQGEITATKKTHTNAVKRVIAVKRLIHRRIVLWQSMISN